MKQENSIIYGYPSPPVMKDIVNLVLTYDKIYDYEERLEPLRVQAKLLARHFSGDKLTAEDVKGWYFSSSYILISSIARYYGFDSRDFIDSSLLKRILWLDEAKSSRKVDRERFIKIIDSYFQLILKNAPAVAQKLISILSDTHRLSDEGIIIPRENLLPEIMKAREATSDIYEAAVEADMKDKEFLSIVHRTQEGEDPWWVSFTLNTSLLESSYLGIPLHLWDPELPLVEYKYKRGAKYLPKLKQTAVIREAFSLLIPEVYTLDIPDLLEVRNSSEFRAFRREIDKVYREVLKAPQNFPDAHSLSEYLKAKYINKLEQLALERRPKPSAVLLKNMISNFHPIAGLLIGGKEVYDEYRDKYKAWKFAVSTLEMKGKLQAFAKKKK